MPRRRSPPDTFSATSANDDRAPGAIREIDALALAVAALCVLLASVSRHHLNIDGVSYLDLAARLRAGDWASFVQGYWSPLYPVLLALAGLVTGRPGAPTLPAVHVLNAVVASSLVALLWRTLRRRGDVILARFGFAALLLCATRPPRVDAVTPDLLLLFAVAVVAIELLEHQGTRWLPLGLALGGAYLAKTSAWPWIASAIALQFWMARTRTAWTAAARSTLVAVVIIAMWAVPLSLEMERPTVGASGRLNACWYLAECDSRSPDSHAGTHRQHRVVPATAGGEPLVAVDMAGTPWTYAPWGDPVAWDAGTGSRSRQPLSLIDLLVYWGAQSLFVFGYWLAPLTLGVLLPVVRLAGPALPWHTLATTARPAAVTLLLGMAGIGQFVLVHAEPRLVAPYALLLALGAAWWLVVPGLPPSPDRPFLRRRWLSVSGLALAVVAAGFTLRDHAAVAARLEARRQAAAALQQAIQAQGWRTDRVVVVGPALPLVVDAWRAGTRIIGQIPPRSLAALGTLSPERQVLLLRELFGTQADVAWVSQGSDAFRVLAFGAAVPDRVTSPP